MRYKVGPVDQLFVNLLEGFGVVVRQLDAFPEVGGRVGALNRLDVEVDLACGLAGPRRSEACGATLISRV